MLQEVGQERQEADTDGEECHQDQLVHASVGWAHQLSQEGHCGENVPRLEQTHQEPGEQVDVEVCGGG